jgi:ABC-type lipoprotein release transport system permease subunit
MRFEKLAIFLILLFVVLIVALNIYGSLSMLIIEKSDDMETLQALGANDTMIRRIFVTEGWLVSLLGMLVGLVAGIGLALLQQRFGFVRMPGNFMVDAYPVVLQLTDVLFTILGVAAIGLTVSLLSAKRR